MYDGRDGREVGRPGGVDVVVLLCGSDDMVNANVFDCLGDLGAKLLGKGSASYVLRYV